LSRRSFTMPAVMFAILVSIHACMRFRACRLCL